MSYAYLFKYIIIGDTGEPMFFQEAVRESPICLESGVDNHAGTGGTLHEMDEFICGAF